MLLFHEQISRLEQHPQLAEPPQTHLAILDSDRWHSQGQAEGGAGEEGENGREGGVGGDGVREMEQRTTREGEIGMPLTFFFYFFFWLPILFLQVKKEDVSNLCIARAEQFYKMTCG